MQSMALSGELKIQLAGGQAALKFTESEQSFCVESVMVPADHRGQGIGRLLMGYVLCMADQRGKSVKLSARPIGQGSRQSDRLERLVHFYTGLGFAVTGRGVTAVEMVRPPGGGDACASSPSPGAAARA
jgi:GNAT superfamily N-acetyltransferase